MINGIAGPLKSRMVVGPDAWDGEAHGDTVCVAM